MNSAAEACPWHDPQWQAVCSALARDRLPHALLLGGPPGLGKLAFAERLAARLLCEAPTVAGEACDRCRACLQRSAGSHADFVRVELLLKGELLAGKKLAQDATQLRIDQVRELSARLALSSTAGGYKVAIIEPAERMNREAANALLKTLEEPTPSTLLVLVTSQPWLLPATVRSRCQTLVFTLPERATALRWLAAHDVGTDEAESLLAVAAGRPLAARSLAGSSAVADRQRAFESFCDLLAGRADPLEVAAGWVRNDPARVFDWVAGWLVDLVRLGSVPGSAIDNTDLSGRLQEISQRIDLSRLFSWLDRLQQHRRLLDTQVNALLLCEDLLVGWTADLGPGRAG